MEDNRSNRKERSEDVALAAVDCAYCQGIGLKPSHGGRMATCNCVYRGIFRLCFDRFRRCVEKEKHRCRVTGEIYAANGQRRVVWGRKDEEYIADFYLVTRRHVGGRDWEIFNYHFLLGADWKLCCQRLKMDKGLFFHRVYRIQNRLGRVFRELAPYPLYPLDEYFRGSTRHHCPKIEPAPKPEERKVVPLRPPVRKRPVAVEECGAEPVPRAA